MNSCQKIDRYRYWTSLVVGSAPTNVEEVGHPDMGREFNLAAYALRLHALERALKTVQCVPSTCSIFESGFGVGFYLQYWKAIGCPRVTGVEISPQAWRNAKAHFPEFDLRLKDVTELHNDDDWPALLGSFDLVTLIDVLYHITDDIAAGRALESVAQLAGPGGILICTEKFPNVNVPVSESPLVRRRPLAWYASVLRSQGFQCSEMVPIFWCMDRRVFNSGQLALAVAGYGAWGLMRVALKYWSRNAPIQNKIGKILGRLGARIDRTIVPRMHKTPNLTMAVFRRV